MVAAGTGRQIVKTPGEIGYLTSREPLELPQIRHLLPHFGPRLGRSGKQTITTKPYFISAGSGRWAKTWPTPVR